MVIFADEPVAFVLVDVAGGIENAVRPEGDATIARVSCELGTLADEVATKPEAARGGFDEEKAQAGGGA